jgi:hypothetical protein
MTPPPNGTFMDRLICYLMPFFLPVAPDLAAARTEILETLASYGARTRAEFLLVAQIIAFSCSALEALGQAKTPDIPAAVQLRYRSGAATLNRASQQTQKSLTARLACDTPDATPQTDPMNDITDAQLDEILRQTDARIELATKKLALTPNPHSKPSAMFDALFRAQHQPPPAAA